MLLGSFQQIAFRADKTLQRHNDLFTDRVDGGIGDLCKQLFEVVIDHAWLI